MKIAVINKKGGVGKTSLAFSLAKDLNLYLLSNDDSVIEIVYEYAKVTDNIKLIDDVVYDFGGFVDAGVLNIINNCNIVIVPLTSDLNSFKKTVSLLNEINNDNIIIVANRTEKNEFQDIKEYFGTHCKCPIIEIRNSKIWKKTFENKKSVLEIKNKNKINQYIYRNSIGGYEKLLQRIKNEK